MAALDDLVAAISRGSITAGVLANVGVTGADAETFRRQVNMRYVNPVVPASVIAALGVTGADASRNLTRRSHVITNR